MGRRDLCFLTALALGGCDVESKSVTATASDGGSSSGPGTTSGGSSISATSTASQTGSSDTDNDSGGAGVCNESVTALPGLDSPGPTGIDPAAVVAEIEAEYFGTMQWANEGFVQLSGPLGPTNLNISLTYAGGAIEDVDAELVSACQHEGPCPCDDRLDVTMRMTVQAVDGTLDETWDVVIQYRPEESDVGAAGASMYHRFQPDDAVGTLSSDVLQIDPTVSLNELVMTGRFHSFAFEGGLNADVTGTGPGGGFAGFGVLSTAAGVANERYCTALSQPYCDLATCLTAGGRRVEGPSASACECWETETFCVPGPLDGPMTQTLYTRQRDNGFEVYDEVVAFPTFEESPPWPWRRCDEAPEVELCGCFDGGGCP